MPTPYKKTRASGEIAALPRASNQHLVRALELLDEDVIDILIQLGNILGFTNVFGPSGPNHSIGLVPDPGPVAGTSKFLREDATWATIATSYDPVSDPFGRALI